MMIFRGEGGDLARGELRSRAGSFGLWDYGREDAIFSVEDEGRGADLVLLKIDSVQVIGAHAHRLHEGFGEGAQEGADLGRALGDLEQRGRRFHVPAILLERQQMFLGAAEGAGRHSNRG